jgi:hypothetical protein
MLTNDEFDRLVDLAAWGASVDGLGPYRILFESSPSFEAARAR